jgi:hypothetical protein
VRPAGLVRLGVVALDGTKVAANAATTASHTHDKIKAQVAEILRQAAETDQREDLEDGQLRLPGPGQAYYQRRRTQGDATGQVVRALKRRIVRAVYQHLRAALPPADTLHTAAA